MPATLRITAVDGNRAPVAGVTFDLHVDTNANAVLDASDERTERTATTGANGVATFAGLAAGQYIGRCIGIRGDYVGPKPFVVTVTDADADVVVTCVQ